MVNSTIFDESAFFMVKASVCCWVKEHVYPLEVKPSIFLVGGLEHDFFFVHSVGNFIIPTDERHHFSEG